MDEHRLVLHDRAVTLLGVLASGVEEEAGADGLPDLDEVAAGRHDVELVPEGGRGMGMKGRTGKVGARRRTGV